MILPVMHADLPKMWQARTKYDLIIEVWEKLDCENVGAAEIEAIVTVVEAEYGKAAVDSPMAIARQLADEGAELRHAEIMKLYVERASNLPYEAAFRSILDLKDLRSAMGTIRKLENLRKKYTADADKEGLRLARATALRGKKNANKIAADAKTEGTARQINIEISQWFSVWLQTPAMFEDWVALRQRSADFKERFGQIRPDQTL